MSCVNHPDRPTTHIALGMAKPTPPYTKDVPLCSTCAGHMRAIIGDDRVQAMPFLTSIVRAMGDDARPTRHALSMAFHDDRALCGVPVSVVLDDPLQFDPEHPDACAECVAAAAVVS